MRYPDDDDDDGIELEHEGMIRETDMAQLYRIDGEKVWIPKSVITETGDDTVMVKSWFAKKEGLA